MPVDIKNELVSGNRLLSVEEVREILGVSRTTLWSLMKSKSDAIPSFRIGGAIRFRLDKLNWWIEKHEQ